MRRYSAAERCMLLLFAPLGEKPLSGTVFGKMRKMLEAIGPDGEASGEVTAAELRRLGLSPENADLVLRRLAQESVLHKHLDTLSRLGITVVTRISPEYPERLRQILGDRAPMLLYCAGNLSLFHTACISLVGSRKLRSEGRRFAKKAGAAIAGAGETYVSGGAVGADTVGLEAALGSGGSGIVFLADSLQARMEKCNLSDGKLLLVSEEGFDVGFSTPRAYSRNRLIHAMGQKVLVAQSDYGTGGTWNGVMENLKNSWSPVYMFTGEPEDEGTRGLLERGCQEISVDDLQDLSALTQRQISLF